MYSLSSSLSVEGEEVVYHFTTLYNILSFDEAMRLLLYLHPTFPQNNVMLLFVQLSIIYILSDLSV